MSISHTNGLNRRKSSGSGNGYGVRPFYFQGVLNDNPSVYWRFNETGGTTATDATNFARNGTYTAGFTLSQTSPVRDVAGKAVLFDGVNGTFVTIADAAWQRPTNGVTFTAWVNPTSIGGGSAGRIFDKSNNTAALAGFTVMIVSSNRLDVIVNGAADVLTPASFLPNGEWHHVAVSINADGAVRIYKDGALNTTGTTNPLSGVTSTSPFRVGSLSAVSTNSWDGLIDEPAMFSYVLTPEQITRQYNLGI